MTIDLENLEALAKDIMAGPRANNHADPIIRNMGRLEHDDACKKYARATNPGEILALIAEVRALRTERDHWKANHDNQVARARFLIERGDIPLERVRAYEEMAALQEFHAFFADRCEGLFMQFGMPAVDAYNKAARGAK